MFRYTRATFVREAVLVLAALVLLSPFYLLLSGSLKTDSESLESSPASLPKMVTLHNFSEAWNGQGQASLPSAILTSVVVTVATIVVLVALGSLAAYTISRHTGRLGAITYGMFVLGIILPFQLGIIPAFAVMKNLGLVGTPEGLIILYSGLLMPLAVFLYTGFARSLPRAYEEAASIDGATRFQIFRRIVFPLLAPATGTVAILAGLIIWNDFFTQLIFLSGSSYTSLPVAVYSYVGSLAARWNIIFAVVIISMIPMLILYIVAQKRFIQAFGGGIKG